jgi:predicted DNA-binding protein (MmcQ/YjbR family)
MTIDDLRAFCLSLPHATEKMQWGDNLLFCVAGKMFAIVSLDAVPPTLCFKCSDEEFLALQEVEGVRPAPYLARAKWVQLDSLSAVSRSELQRLLAAAHGTIFAKLPKKTRMSLEAAPSRRARARRA